MSTEQKLFESNRVGVIDIGTLKTKFVVAEFDDRYKRKILVRDRKITNLGQGINNENKLISKDAVMNQERVLIELVNKMNELGVHTYTVIGTETLRNADNMS